MNSTHAKQLFETFPDVFDRMLLAGGFGCQDGWFDLLIELGHSLHRYRNRTSDAEYPVITAVEQKRGVLQISTRGADPTTRSLIDAAQETSTTICELDGNPAAGRYGCLPAWVRPLCKACADMHDCMSMEDYLANRDHSAACIENVHGPEHYAL